VTPQRELYERDPEAWNAYLAEGNARQARKRVSADILLRDQRDRILLVDPTYKPDWDLPGGMAEANEPPPKPSAASSAKNSASTSPSAACCVSTGCRHTAPGTT
jgi:hypothetical protein